MCIYICTNTHTHTTYSHRCHSSLARMHACVYILHQMRTYIHTYVYVCMYVYIYICIHTYMYQYTYIYIHTHIHTHIHTYIHTCIHTCIEDQMHTNTHTHTHKTYIHRWSLRCSACSNTRRKGLCTNRNLTTQFWISSTTRPTMPLPQIPRSTCTEAAQTSKK